MDLAREEDFNPLQIEVAERVVQGNAERGLGVLLEFKRRVGQSPVVTEMMMLAEKTLKWRDCRLFLDRST